MTRSGNLIRQLSKEAHASKTSAFEALLNRATTNDNFIYSVVLNDDIVAYLVEM